MSGTVYQVTIHLSNETLQALVGGNFSLYALRAFQATAGGGQPLVWIATNHFSTTTVITWTPSYGAFASSSLMAVNGTIIATSEIPIDFGQVAPVQNDGIMSITNNGPAGAMSILSPTSTPWTCGLVLQNYPIVAFPLFGNSMDAIVPLEQVFLMFESYPAQTGQILETTFSEGALIDLTSGTQRDVTFDINAGWSFDGASWGQAIPPNTLLAPLLIQHAALQG